MTNTTVIEGIHYKTGERIALHMKDGLIAGIRPAQSDDGECSRILGPGLVDLQINGHRGYDFNTLPIADGVVAQATRALWQEGVTSYFPTVITNSDAAIEQAMRAIADACSQDALVEGTVSGIHLEGPFISPEDGARGAHGKQYVKAPDWSLFERWQEAAQGRIKIVTLSPEWPEAPGFIAKCAENGVTVSIGHTAAAPEQIREAVAAGARMTTHFGNGAHLMLPRHPNYLWEQLAQEELWTCVIADGFHLPEAVLKVVMKVKGDKAMIVSDAVQLSGMEPGEYDLHIGGKVVLTREGRLHIADNPKLLAGSAQMLIWGIGHLVRSKLCSMPEAWEMASVRPGGFMRLPAQAGLAVGAPADVVVFERNKDAFRVLQTFKEGVPVFQQEG